MQADRSLRSVFVGNIPYDATEEKLREIFSAVGPVLSFRIVFDRDTGKPKGYGFCEYKDQETATSAMRNLNGHDLGGRQLRVDSASNERARDEPDQMQQQQQQQQHQQQQQQNMQHQQQQQQSIQHQPQPEPSLDAQTVINNELCSIPPEGLFEVCRQLKESLAINPNETRQMLLMNPQLSFAILQTLVMIKAIDAPTAMNTLHKQLMPAPLPTMMTMVQPSLLNPYGFMGGQPQPVPVLPMAQTLPPPLAQPQAQAQLQPQMQQQLAPQAQIQVQVQPQAPPQPQAQPQPQPQVQPIQPAVHLKAAPMDPRLASRNYDRL